MLATIGSRSGQSKRVRRRGAFATIQKLGLLTGLTWVADAGDRFSYPAPAAQSLGLIPPGSGVQLVLGNDNTVDAARDAVFSGNIGGNSANEYFLSSGTTSTPITRIGAPLGAWSDAHKDNAIFTFAGVFYTDPASDGAIFFTTFTDLNSGIGVNLGLASASPGPAQHPFVDVGNGSGSAFAAQPVTTSIVGNKGQILFAGFSVDEAANKCTFVLNGAAETVACTYSSPSGSAPTFPNAIIAASTNINTSTGRIYNAAWWTRALSTVELLALYDAQRSKFGF